MIQFSETFDQIKERMIANIKNGVNGFNGISNLDTSENSQIDILFNAYVEENANVSTLADEVYQKIIPFYATGEALDIVGNSFFGLSRKQATNSLAYLKLTGTGTLAIGSQFQTVGDVNTNPTVFVTTEEMTIRSHTGSVTFDTDEITGTGFAFQAGDYIQISSGSNAGRVFKVVTASSSSLTVIGDMVDGTLSTTIYTVAKAQCTTSGIAGNVGAGTITSIRVPIAGITACTNVTSATGGDDTEIDGDMFDTELAGTTGYTDVVDTTTYRGRIIDSLKNNTGKLTLNGYRQTVLSYDGVDECFVTNEYLATGTGNPLNIWIYPVYQGGIPSAGILSDIYDNLFTGTTGDLNRGMVETITMKQYTEVTYNIGTVNITLDTGSVEDEVEEAIIASVDSYFNSLALGDDVYLVKVINAIDVTGTGVKNFTFSSAPSDQAITTTQRAIKGTLTINFV